LSSIMLKSSSGKTVRLGDVATVSYDSVTSQITRFDRSVSVSINASLAPGHDLGGQVEAIRKWAKTSMSDGGRIAFSGDAEMMKESFISLLQTLLIAMLLIYIVLAGQFNSFIHPFTIMTALPFAVSGALITLFLANEGLSIMSFIGMIMLMGIVTKNSILLIDFALQQIRDGVAVVDALVESSRVRLRPILMTAGGTIMGMVPVIASTAQGAEIKHSMGWAVFGGLIFSTLITLFIVPVVFSLFDGIGKKN
ncbi:efflux RND transporter permease subunit, partial [bacterium]|nr:efflux RND transporter permease subunit [bacterium]